MKKAKLIPGFLFFTLLGCGLAFVLSISLALCLWITLQNAKHVSVTTELGRQALALTMMGMLVPVLYTLGANFVRYFSREWGKVNVRV